MNSIEVYTDGSATVATKPGGWGYVIVENGQKILQGSGRIENATNNDAELQAAIEGLKAVRDRVHSVWVDTTLVSDSQIVLNWASGKNRFKQKNKIDKYNELRQLMRSLDAKTRWVKGHSGDRFNEICDKLANAARKGTPVNLTKKQRAAMKPKKEFGWNDANVDPSGISLKERLELSIRSTGTINREQLLQIVLELVDLEESRNK